MNDLSKYGSRQAVVFLMWSGNSIAMRKSLPTLNEDIPVIDTPKLAGIINYMYTVTRHFIIEKSCIYT